MRLRPPLLLTVLAAALAACPHLPEPSGCRPRSYRCADNPADEPAGAHPEVCSASQRWTRIGDVGCQAIPPGTATCVVENGLAFCANPAAPAPAAAPQSRRAVPDATVPRAALPRDPGVPERAARAVADAAGAVRGSMTRSLRAIRAMLPGERHGR